MSAIDRTNTLVIRCPDWMYEEIIDKVITPMEKASEDSLKVVQVVDIANGVDPSGVSLAIDALYGRRPQTGPGMGGFGNRGQGGWIWPWRRRQSLRRRR